MRLGGCIKTATCHRVTGKPYKGCFQKISIHDTIRTWRSCIAVGSFLALRGRHAPLCKSWISSIISFRTRLGQFLGQVLNVCLWQVYACGMYTPSVVFKLLSGVLQGFWLTCWYVSSSRCRLKRIGAAKALVKRAMCSKEYYHNYQETRDLFACFSDSSRVDIVFLGWLDGTGGTCGGCTSQSRRTSRCNSGDQRLQLGPKNEP